MKYNTYKQVQVKDSDKLLELIRDKRDQTFFVHYSCESFVESKSSSKKIISIAVKNLSTEEVVDFAIFSEAELLGISVQNIEMQYEVIEKNMLNKFFNFLRKNKKSLFVHWNMRDAVFGFKALEHRAAVVGARSFELGAEQKIDLSKILTTRFGKEYVGHNRMENIFILNKMTMKNFIQGKREPDYFKEGKFYELHQSTLRKVDNIQYVVELVLNGNLKVETGFFEQRGYNLRSLADFFSDNPVCRVLSFLAVLYTLFDLLSRHTSVLN